ncbi:MAG: ABC transporter permease [Chloroflexi bacterium]|nr:ABC transporter permease [Chloroflexota bacterium]MBI5704504.1 ABC transporter permease [Chloroflexota bacterium]GER78858.1 antimicrobial peptide ABC transporter permease [Candidatus Denitrolinea symbiosum]
MTRLAFRNLFQNKARLVISVGGVALALLLILALDAIFTGVERQVTAYIDKSGADIWVSQEDVFNMHMAFSSLPDSVARKVKIVPGVESVTPIHYLTNNIVAGDERNLAYIIGLTEDASIGGPWMVSSGRSLPVEGEAIMDRSVAEKSGIALGDEVEILGEEFEIVGLSEGTASLVNSVAFISMKDFEALRGSYDTFSYLLVNVEKGESPQVVAARIEARIRDVTVQTVGDFAAQERKVVKDMSTDVITIMNLIGFLIGLAVMALTVYTSTLSRRREYGMLKALGARNTDLYRTVLAQALLSVTLGFLFGLSITLLLTLVIPLFGSNLALEISRFSLLKVAAVSLVTAGLSAMIPIRQIAGLDPAMVFRGR